MCHGGSSLPRVGSRMPNDLRFCFRLHETSWAVQKLMCSWRPGVIVAGGVRPTAWEGSARAVLKCASHPSANQAFCLLSSYPGKFLSETALLGRSLWCCKKMDSSGVFNTIAFPSSVFMPFNGNLQGLFQQQMSKINMSVISCSLCSWLSWMLFWVISIGVILLLRLAKVL